LHGIGRGASLGLARGFIAARELDTCLQHWGMRNKPRLANSFQTEIVEGLDPNSTEEM
jgi:hypothetical protein